MRAIASMFLLLAVPAGEDKIPMPDGPPPTIQVISALDADKGTLVFQRVDLQKVPVQVTEIVQMGNQQVAVTKTVYKDASRVVHVTQSLKEMQIQTASGNKLTAADAFRQLKVGSAVLVSVNGQPVSRAYLTIVNPDTIVLIPRVANVPVPAPLPEPLPKPKV